MDPLPFTLVMISAITHSMWNYLAKTGKDKEAYMLVMNIAGFILLIPIYWILLPDFSFPIEALPFLIISSLAETVYFLGLGKAYEKGDLSVVYPVARSSPMFVAIIAVFLLDEKINLWGIFGIMLIFIGVYMLHLKSLKRDELLAPLRYIREPASKYALLAALGTTIYSISDKIGVTTISPIQYSFWLGIIIPSLLIITIVPRKGIEKIRDELDGSIVRISLSAILMRGGYLLVLFAMSIAQVSYILALRQVSVVLGALLGIVLLKEKYGKIRLIGSIIILIGVYLLGAMT